MLCCGAGAVAVAPDDDKSAGIEADEKAFTKHMTLRSLTIDDFVSEESLFAMLKPSESGLAPCALLDGEWMLRRAKAISEITDREDRKRLALPRRQILEKVDPGAYMSVDTLRMLPRGDSRINEALPLVCVSHCWHGPGHPDPYGDNLLTLAEAVQKARLAGEKTEEHFERFPKGNFAVFFDWVSLHQRDENGLRTRDENAAFHQALSKMNIWYAHMKTLVYLLTATPSAWPPETPAYGDRGWPSFERMITMLLKHQSGKCWATICDVGAFAEGGIGRTVVVPPKAPEDFEEMLSRLKFTNNADKKNVMMLYKDTLDTALGQARSLRYTGLRWGDQQMRDLVKVLPLCRKLVYLNLKGSHNAYTSESAALLTDILGRDGVLPNLKMIGAGSREAAAEDQDPLLEDAKLHAVCEARGVSLLRDVPFELVDELRAQTIATTKAGQRRTKWQHAAQSRATLRRRSSVVMTMRSVLKAVKRTP